MGRAAEDLVPVHRAEHDLDHRPPNAITRESPSTGSADSRQRCDQRLLDELPAGESINGGDCGKPNAVVRDPGAVWLSSGIAEVPAPPTCQELGKDGLWPDWSRYVGPIPIRWSRSPR